MALDLSLSIELGAHFAAVLDSPLNLTRLSHSRGKSPFLISAFVLCMAIHRRG